MHQPRFDRGERPGTTRAHPRQAVKIGRDKPRQTRSSVVGPPLSTGNSNVGRFIARVSDSSQSLRNSYGTRWRALNSRACRDRRPQRTRRRLGPTRRADVSSRSHVHVRRPQARFRSPRRRPVARRTHVADIGAPRVLTSRFGLRDCAWRRPTTRPTTREDRHPSRLPLHRPAKRFDGGRITSPFWNSRTVPFDWLTATATAAVILLMAAAAQPCDPSPFESVRLAWPASIS